ncbi:hypothetical protein CCP3SC1_1240004 [Gammaproteobacteria bacterium]
MAYASKGLLAQNKKVVQTKDWVLYRLDRHSFRRQSLGLEKHPRVTRFRFTSCRLPFGGQVESQASQPAEWIPLG